MYYISINKIHNNVRKYNDLYVEIKYNNQKRRTHTIWNNLLPVWNEKFVFDLDENFNHFFITIYEKNVWTSTEKLHEAKINLNRDNIQTFKYKYLEISHGIPFHNKIKNINTENKIIKMSNDNLKNINKQLNNKIKKLEEDNNTLIEENKYLKDKNDSLKYNILIKDDEYNNFKKKINLIKNDFKKINQICNNNI